jgi:hypothetical protein
VSARPEDEDERRGFLDSPKWMDGPLAMLAAPGFAILGIFLAIGAVVLLICVLAKRLSSDWYVAIVGLTGASILCFVLYSRTGRRMASDDAPRGAPPDRLFPIALLARGGWLRQYLEPTVAAHVVIGDQDLHVRYRRPMNQLWLAAMVFQFAPQAKHLGFPVPPALCLAGLAICTVAFLVSMFRRHDIRFAWADVLSVSATKDRFHVQVRDEDHPDGVLFAVKAKHFESVRALLAARTLFHEEG